MADKICSFCLTHYIDDPFLTEHPGHTPEKCLQILNARLSEARSKSFDAAVNLRRAEKFYNGKEG